MTADRPDDARDGNAVRDAADADGYRPLRCPRCGRRMIDVSLGSTGTIRARCRKCKFEGTLDLGRFRKQRRRSRRLRTDLTDLWRY